VADRKISDLTALTTPATGDLIPIVDVSEAAAADKNKSITVGELLRGAPDGTAAAPGFAFESDGGNGMFLGGTDILAFSTGGTQAVTIDASQRLGIGTSSPSNRLEVANAGYTGIATKNTSNSVDALFASGTSRGEIGTTTNHDFDIFTNGSSKIRILAAGNVGIGTTSPGRTLDVNGIIRSDGTSGGLAFGGNSSTPSEGVAIHRPAANTLAFVTDSTERVRIDGSGRLLVGTSSGSGDGILIVQGGAGTSAADAVVTLRRGSNNPSSGIQALGQIRFEDLSGGWGAQISAVSDGSWSTTTDCPTYLKFAVTADGASSPTERMRIKNDGASQFFSSTNTTTVRAVNGSTSGTAHRLFYGLHSGTAVNNGTAIYSIFTNGTVGTPSDIRLKKNVESTRDGYLDDIANLRVVKYHWKTQDDTEPKELGLIAQEVEQVFPGLIRTEGEGDDEVKEIKRSVIPFMLLKALQEANSKIEAQQVVISDLLARVTALEAN
jgi:hypothetical protein